MAKFFKIFYLKEAYYACKQAVSKIKVIFEYAVNM